MTDLRLCIIIMARREIEESTDLLNSLLFLLWPTSILMLEFNLLALID